MQGKSAPHPSAIVTQFAGHQSIQGGSLLEFEVQRTQFSTYSSRAAGNYTWSRVILVQISRNFYAPCEEEEIQADD